MAGITTRRGRWVVRWYDTPGVRKNRNFTTEEEARAFLATLPARPVATGSRSAGAGRGLRPRNRSEIIDHLVAQFEVADDGCWTWTGRLNKDGYSMVNWKRANRVVRFGHRVVLAAIGEPLIDGLVIDHLCRNRACVNPDHLEQVTGRENVMRSPIAPGALNAAKTHCFKGHEFTPENTTISVNPGGRKTTTRVCRTCMRDRYQAKKASAA